MHSKLPLTLSIAALVVVTIPSVSAQTPIIYYDFNSDPALSTGSSIDNKGSGGTDGTFNAGNNVGNIFSFITSGAPGPSGQALSLTPATDGVQNLDSSHINTGFSLLSLGITPSTPYTAMAWVNWGSLVNDNMIFGQDGAVATGGQSLHLGSRRGNYMSGHWADDIGPDAGAGGVMVPTGTGSWHHVAYQNLADGTQRWFIDGVQGPDGGFGTAGSMDVNQLMLIGTSNNGGSFSGQLDEIKVFSQALSAAEIQAASVVVPEPSSIAVLTLSGIGMAAMLRRRRVRL